MTFGYSRSLMVAVGVVAFAAPQQSSSPVVGDARVVRLHSYLNKLHCPVAPMAREFVRAADDNHLDWRLLPSIAVIESGGGKAYRHNNIFGWNGGKQAFPTIQSGMELVAYKLGRSPLYRGRSSFGKLRIYNEDQEYATSVLSVMNRISPKRNLDVAEIRY